MYKVDEDFLTMICIFVVSIEFQMLSCLFLRRETNKFILLNTKIRGNNFRNFDMAWISIAFCYLKVFNFASIKYLNFHDFLPIRKIKFTQKFTPTFLLFDLLVQFVDTAANRKIFLEYEKNQHLVLFSLPQNLIRVKLKYFFKFAKLNNYEFKNSFIARENLYMYC